MHNDTSNTNSSEERTIDMSALVARYRRYWWLPVLSLTLCLAAAILYIVKTPPAYMIVSTVLVDRDDNASGVGAAMLKSMSLDIGGGKVDDEVVVMGSHELCRQMVARLKLNRSYIERRGFMNHVEHYGDSPIEIDVPDAVLDTLSIAMQFKIKVDEKGLADVTVKRGWFKTLARVESVKLPATVRTPYGIYVVKTTPYYKAGNELTVNSMVMGNDMKAEQLSRIITVKVLSKKTNAIYLDAIDRNVQRGRDKLNTLIALYNERGERDKQEQGLHTADFINDRLTLIYNDLMGSEAEIEAYKRAHNMVDVELQTRSLIGKQEQADAAIVALEARYRIVGMIRDFVSDPANNGSLIPFSADSTAATGAIKSYNALVMQRMKLENSAQGDNQALRQIDDQLDVMRANVLKGVNNTLGALKIQIDKASGVSGASAAKMSGFPTQEREMRNLYREQGIQNTLYTFLLQKREENALVMAANTPRGKVVDTAYAKSEPVRPQKAFIIFGALLLGLLIPIVILYLKNLLTTRFSTQEELEALTPTPVVGCVQHNRHSEPLVVREGKSSTIVEMFRYLRESVQFMLTGSDNRVILVTSSVSGEGKSFVSANLAAAFALRGKRVALVGMDIRKPQLADMFDTLATEPGVTSYLADPQVTLADVAQPSREVSGLDVIVAGAVPPNPSELLQSDRTDALIAELRESYDIVVLDSAPIAMVSDTFTLAGAAAVTLYVTRAGFTHRRNVKFFNQVVKTGRLPHAYLVLNDTKPSRDVGYGYGYGDEK